MQDYYLKDIKVLRIILVFTIIGAICLVGYSYYKGKNNSDYSINMVYKSGQNTYRFGQSYEYKFDVIGYNNTNEDLIYNLYAYNGLLQDGERLDDEMMIIYLKENEEIIKGPIIPDNLQNGLFIGQFIIPKNYGNYAKEYEIILGTNTEKYGDIIDDKLNYYNVNVKLFLVK